jgi:hypothetical protein
MYELFSSDPSAEKEGIALDYGEFRVTIARAGGANKRYAKLLNQKSKPFQRLIQLDQLDNDKAIEILMDVHSLCVVKNWEVKDEDGKWVDGIESADGKAILPVTPANIFDTFKALPDLFADIREQAEKGALFRNALREEAAGNSSSASSTA